LVFNKMNGKSADTITRLVPGDSSLSPPAALSQREDRGYNSTEHVDKAIRRLIEPSLCCSSCHEDLIRGPALCLTDPPQGGEGAMRQAARSGKSYPLVKI
jgi:hypothetical protein